VYEFKQAKREQVGLLIGLVGSSGSGKTMSAMRLASGIVGKGNRFALIDTESRRALHYAEMFDFDHCELNPPFRPDHYADAIKAAAQKGYKAIVVDSASHEWAGEGGILDWQEEELTRMAGEDYRKRDNCKMAAWIKPKMAHKQMVQRWLQINAHLILCFRAEEKVKMEKDEKGKTQIVPIGWQPICSKELPFELTVSFLLTADKPGIPQPIKLQEQHKIMFPAGKLLSEESGQLIAQWAAGGIKPEEKAPLPSTPTPQENPATGNVTNSTAPSVYISEAQGKRFFAISNKSELPLDQVKLFLMHYYGIDSSKKIPKDKYEEICGVIESKEKFDIMMKAIPA